MGKIDERGGNTMTIDYTAYIEAQTNLATCRERVRTFQKRLDILLKRQAPSPINSQSYDRPSVQNGFAKNEVEELYEIAEASEQLGIAKLLLDEAQLHFDTLDAIFKKAEQEMIEGSSEMRVFRLRQSGLSNQQIADQLGYTYGTVCVYVSRVNAKISGTAN
jgi:ATP/maltotriose-dependent transcriptional regulator MalT